MVKGCAGFRGSTHTPVEKEMVPVEKRNGACRKRETVPVENPDIILTLL